CSQCGAPCKVPFQPSGDKPVYCSECFAAYRANRQ
ncbi:MAG TPA: zinc-binding protein, partial [Bacillota bacterium]|nr:zinc-binding protein [Bacillota bacterium]